MTTRTLLRRAGLVAAGLVIGAGVTLWYSVKEFEASFVDQWSAILPEQTHILKFLRRNRAAEIQVLLEESAWKQIEALAQRKADRKGPREFLKGAIAYHCAYNAEHAAAVDPKVAAERVKWCAALEAK